KPFKIETNALEYTLREQLSQQNNQEHLRIISNFSRKLNSLEINYRIPNQKLIAIVKAFEE
ncbi:hypothetical protein M406DRAFT_248099, partial [Cryphonectria parasitica EP155]